VKILHFADLHLGVESYGQLDPTTGLSSRFGDFLAALDEVVDYALDNGIDLVLFCGDAYKSREPSQTQQREFAKRIKRLATAGITVFLLTGNHDLPNAISRATTVEIFDALKVENVVVANHPDIFTIETKSGILQIVALPWARRSTFLNREDCKGLSFDQINRRLEYALIEWLSDAVQSLNPELPALLAAHLSLITAMPGSEKSMIVGREHVLLQSDVALPPFDYVALGHIHRHQVLGQNPPVVYPGSLCRIDFSDEGQEKGFYVIELDGTRVQGERAIYYKFHPVNTRRFLTIEVNADAENPTAAVLQALANKETKDAIVRVRIRVPAHKEGLIREAEVYKALKDAHYVAIAEEVQREHRLRLGSRPTEEMTPLEILKLYLDSKGTAPERAEKLLKYGERLIRQQGE
jgi:exonuclease SbcD